MSNSLIFFVVAVLIVGVLLFFVISTTKKKGSVLDQEKYQTKWLKIEHDLNKDEPATYHMVILEADKLLDKALTELGIQGAGLGERLKKSGDMFTSINSVWHAHKLRNQIAHEENFSVNYNQAIRALTSFKQALKDVGAI